MCILEYSITPEKDSESVKFSNRGDVEFLIAYQKGFASKHVTFLLMLQVVCVMLTVHWVDYV